MPTYRTQVQILSADGVPANYATNTWHCIAPDLVELALWETALVAFYEDISTYIGSLAKPTSNNLYFKHYDLADPQPRAPVLEGFRNYTPNTTGCLPPECALVLSFQANKTSGVPQARRRNRIYIPFLTSASNGSDGRPVGGFLTAVEAAGAALLAASGPTGSDWIWAIYSPTDNAADEVASGWTDNEWDTQRRRGREATLRYTF